jgi:hypothetical protein
MVLNFEIINELCLINEKMKGFWLKFVFDILYIICINFSRISSDRNDENGNLPDCPDKSVLADACNVSNNNNNRVNDPDHHTTNVTATEGVGDDGRGSGNVRSDFPP